MEFKKKNNKNTHTLPYLPLKKSSSFKFPRRRTPKKIEEINMLIKHMNKTFHHPFTLPKARSGVQVCPAFLQKNKCILQ